VEEDGDVKEVVVTDISYYVLLVQFNVRISNGMAATITLLAFDGAIDKLIFAA